MNRYYVVKINKEMQCRNDVFVFGKTRKTLLGYCDGAEELYHFLMKAAWASPGGEHLSVFRNFEEWCKNYTCTSQINFEKEYKASKYMIYDYKNGKKRYRNAFKIVGELYKKEVKHRNTGLMWKWSCQNKAEFRKDPIPFTGKKCNWWRGLCFRSFGKVKDDITMEQKLLEKELPNTKIKVQRAKRNITNMPSNWDDIKYEIPKNWKHSRKTQYKQAKINCRNKKQIWDQIIKDAESEDIVASFAF